MRVDAVDILIRGQELLGCFWPDRGHARYVIGTVAGESQEVSDLIDTHAKALRDFLRAPDAIPHRIPEQHVGPNQRHQVLVRAHDDDAQAALSGVHDHARNQVVCLDSGLHVNGHAQRSQQLLDAAHLLAQIWGGFRAMRLILRIELFAESLLARVHGHRQERRVTAP